MSNRIIEEWMTREGGREGTAVSMWNRLKVHLSSSLTVS